MKSLIQAICICLAAVGFGCLMPASALAQNRAEGSFLRTLNASGIVDLDVSTGSGSIDIRRGSNNVIEVRGRIRAGNNWFRSSRNAEDVVRTLESNPPIEQMGNLIRIGRILDRDSQQNVSISYEITVPAQANIRAHTGSGRAQVEGIDGRVDTGTGSGSITLRDIRGDISANTGSGGIRASNVRGGLRMQTGSGGIEVQGEQTGRWDLQTGSGGIDIDLPQNASFDLSAHTGSGGIDLGFPMTVQGRIDSRRDLSGRVGNGGPMISARTGSGSIRIQ